MSEDSALLQRYASERSEPAFAALVNQYLGFVYHTALRQLNGDTHGAEDVAQIVFADLARQANRLARQPMLAGWLHTRARHAALQFVRTERRRKAREQEAYLMQELIQEAGPVADWNRLRPVLDDALQGLNAVDREALLLRFFQGRGFAEVGARLKLSEDGARSRVDRALVKMELLLARRGVKSTASALGLALTNQAMASAPAGLAASVTGAVMSGVATGGSSAALTLGYFSLMKVSTALLAGSLLLNAFLMATGEGGNRLSGAVPGARPLGTGAGVSKTAIGPWAVYDPDPAVFLERLRSAGVSERVRRALITAAIDAQFHARETALLPAKSDAPWWRWQDTRLPMQTSLALLDLRREKARLKQQLLGPDPESIAADDTDNTIAPEKREMLQLITEDYSTMLASLKAGNLQLPIERQQIQLLEEQRKRDLVELLSPEELAAYEERTWTGLALVKDRIRMFDATDEEFAAIRTTRQKADATLAATGMTTVADMAEEDAQIRSALGNSRFAEYNRSFIAEFRDLQLLLERSGMDRGLAATVYNLRDGFATEANRINDNAQSYDQGLAQLKQLAQRTRERILQQLGPEVGAAYLKQAERWISSADRGSVITFTHGGSSSGHLLGFPAPPSPLPPSPK